MDPRFLQQVKDKDLPLMLFLSVNPTRLEKAQQEVVSAPTHTDRGAVGISFAVTAEVFSDGDSDSSGRVLSKFMISLQEKSMIPVRREFELRLLELSTLRLQGVDSLSTLESNFSDENDQLSADEEDVLEFTEIFECLNYPVPEKIKERFDTIVTNKRIPFRESEGSKKKTFFVYAENKVLMKVCNSLSETEVHEMYRIVQNMKGEEQDDGMKKSLTLPNVPLEAMKEVAGLKDVAFYCLVLSLMRMKMINRLYTHRLNFLLDQLQQMHTQNKDPHDHIDRALATLSRYPIASRPPGLCLVFPMMKERPGADKDLKLVEDLFENVFMYDVFVKKDPTAEQIKSIISKLKAARNKFYDSLVVWFMGHGSKSHLRVKDGEIHRRLDLIKPFTEIEWFFNKPKLFFIQACAVKENSKRCPSSSCGNLKAIPAKTDLVGWRAPAGDSWQEKYADYTDVSKINCFADTLISNATMWYQPAARNEKGSLYVDTLVDQLKVFGSKESIENVLRRVHYNVNTVSLLQNVPGEGEVSWKQAPYFESSLQKEFIFPKTSNQ